MASNVKPIPEGYHTVTPYLYIKDAAGAIEFYKKAFGARELMRFQDPSGKVSHAEIQIGSSPVMLAEEYPEAGIRGPQTAGSTSVAIHLYLEDVDAVAEQAIAAGAKVVRPIEDKFYGDRSGTLEDPYGHSWHVSTHKEDVSIEEMKRRAAALYGAK